MQQALRQPVQVSRKRAADKADMPAFGRLFEADARADLCLAGQMVCRQKRVIFRVDRQGGDADRGQPGFGGSASPVVVGAGKAMHRRGDGIVKLVKVDRLLHADGVEESGKALQAGGRDGFQGIQKVLRIEAVEAACQMVAAAGEVERGAHRGDAGDQRSRRFALFAGPFEQRIAAKGDTGGMQVTALIGMVQAAQDPVDFRRIAGVLGAWLAIQFAGAAAKMRQHEMPASLPAGTCR